MITTVQRWGNSLAIRIPKPFAAQAQLEEDAAVDISIEGDRIVIAPARTVWSLDELLSQVKPANLHREINWGKAKGKESW